MTTTFCSIIKVPQVIQPQRLEKYDHEQNKYYGKIVTNEFF